jgi:hypothetical protein
MNIEYLDTEPTLYVKKEYGVDNEDLTIDQLTEVYVIVYTYKKKGVQEVQEVYTFTTDFDQALKRFKLLPHTKALLKRILTDDEELIKLAVDGTKDKIDESDLSKHEGISMEDLLGPYRDEGLDVGCKVSSIDEEQLSKMLMDAGLTEDVDDMVCEDDHSDHEAMTDDDTSDDEKNETNEADEMMSVKQMMNADDTESDTDSYDDVMSDTPKRYKKRKDIIV